MDAALVTLIDTLGGSAFSLVVAIYLLGRVVPALRSLERHIERLDQDVRELRDELIAGAEERRPISTRLRRHAQQTEERRPE